MAETIRLAPHDPVPDYGDHVLVLRRMGEDDPNSVVTELVFYGAHPSTVTAVDAGGQAMGLEQAVLTAEAEATRRGLSRVYVVDRMAGKLEQEVLAGHGSRAFVGDDLADSDPEDGEAGTSLQDRPHDAGFMR